MNGSEEVVKERVAYAKLTKTERYRRIIEV